MILLHPSIEDRAVQSFLDPYLTVFSGAGVVDDVSLWARRRLAYEIKKCDEAVYVIVLVRTSSSTVREFQRQLNINESVLRLKVMRRDPKAH